AERPGDAGHGERAYVLRDACDEWRPACPGAAAHACGDEHHVGALERVLQFLAGLLGRGASAVGISADAEAARDPVADANAHLGVAAFERLCVGVYANELHAGDARLHHAVDGVAAATSYADYLARG